MNATEWIAPTITGIVTLIVGLLGGLMARRGSKLSNVEQRAPDVQEMWVQQETDRRIRQIVEDIWWNLRRAFQSYYRRVSMAVARMDLPEHVARKFELTDSELRAIDDRPPSE